MCPFRNPFFCFGFFFLSIFLLSILPRLDMRRCISDSRNPERVTILGTHVNIDSRSLYLDIAIKKLLTLLSQINVNFYKQYSIVDGFRTLCFYISIPTDCLLPPLCGYKA